jgi:hypothetical protein
MGLEREIAIVELTPRMLFTETLRSRKSGKIDPYITTWYRDLEPQRRNKGARIFRVSSEYGINSKVLGRPEHGVINRPVVGSNIYIAESDITLLSLLDNSLVDPKDVSPADGTRSDHFLKVREVVSYECPWKKLIGSRNETRPVETVRSHPITKSLLRRTSDHGPIDNDSPLNTASLSCHI